MKSKIVREVLIKNFFYQFASSKDRSLISFLDIVVIENRSMNFEVIINVGAFY